MVSNLARRRARRRVAVLSAVAVSGVAAAMPVHSADPDTATDQLKTATPIKHLIVVIGENRTFDHVYGTYVPKSGASILNLLSERIVGKSGKPGQNFAAAQQFTTSGQTSYFIGVSKKNKTLPDYALSSAIKTWYKTGTRGCFCGFERWRATKCNFKRGSARPSLLFFTEQRISAGRR